MSGSRTRVQVSKAVKLPDALRVTRCLRAPELGPRITFFSGGSALTGLSRKLKLHTHNSTHLITPFDSGGSSGILRKAFDMLSIGDFRARLVALADESVKGNPEIYQLFRYRLPRDGSPPQLRDELQDMVDAKHPLMLAVPEPLRQIVQRQLLYFQQSVPEDFNLRGANMGNLMLVGGYLMNQRNIESTLFLHSRLLEVRGTVRPILQESYHLRARLADGSEIVGQHCMTGKEVPPLEQPIVELDIVDCIDRPHRITPEADPRALRLVEKSDLVVFPMGSFFTSVVANLLPKGVGNAIVNVDCPKVYVPNTGNDPEQLGYELADTAELLLRYVRRDLEQTVPVSRILHAVLVDSRSCGTEMEAQLRRITELGVQVVDTELVSDASFPKIDPERLAEALVCIAQ